MRKIYFLLLTLLISSMSFGQLVINEIDADTPGSDAAEFIELKWTPNTSLDGYIVVLFNGSNDLSYATYDLSGKTTDANGFFILANTALISGSDIDLGASNGLQNGADAVAIYQASAASFPNDSAITTTGLIDALVYGTNDADDTELLSGFGETVQWDESANGASDTQSIQRKMDGTYETKTPTFRASNDAAVCDLSLTSVSATCDGFTSGTDTYSVTIGFTGGGNSTYTVNSTSGTVGGDSPSSVADGTITVTGVSEGTDITVTVADGGLCDLSSVVSSPSCEPSNTLPLYEGFDYTPGTDLIASPNWDNISTSSDEVLVGGPGGLTYPGLASTSGTGNHVTFDGIGSDPAIAFTPVTSGTVYASFIFQVTNQTGVTDSDGGYFALLGEFDARIWMHPNPADTGTTFEIGVSNVSSNPPFTPTTYNVGDNIFVVVSYDLATGQVNGWVNPASSTFGNTAPAPLLTDTDTSIATSIAQFALRQDSATETPFILFDELRIGTTWASVTPTTLSVNEFDANNFKIYPNPTSVGYVNISSTDNSAMSVAVFDVLGKQVLNQSVSNNRLNVASLKSGIYIMKISQNNATITKKLVIK